MEDLERRDKSFAKTLSLIVEKTIPNYRSLTVQPIKLPGKQVKILSDQFPFWICSDIRHWGRVTWPDESSEVQVTRSVASKHEGRSESEHVVEASLLKDEDGKPVVRRR